MGCQAGCFVFFGRPPFFPFRRLLAAFFADVANPPRRPRATAAGFFSATLILRIFGACRIDGFDAVLVITLEHKESQPRPIAELNCLKLGCDRATLTK